MTEPAPAWWRSFVDGDLAGFGQLIETYQRHVLAVALATVIDRSLADDVVQETFLAAHAHRSDVRDPAAVRRWLASIARNKARDMLRAQRREALTAAGELELTTTDDASPQHDIEVAALRCELARALARVPASLREALVLYYAHDHSAEHVARELGLSEAATMQRLSRGRKLMRQYAAALEEYVRPRRGLAAAVVALLALRIKTAHAAKPRIKPPAKLVMFGATAAAFVFGATLIDDAATRGADARRSTPAHLAAIEPAVGANIVPGATGGANIARGADVDSPRIEAAADIDAATIVAHPEASSLAGAAETRLARARTERRSPTRPSDPIAAAHADIAAAVEVTADVEVSAPAVPPAAAPSLCPCPTTPHRDWDPANGFVETAALPRPGEVMLEMLGLDWITRVGLSDHLAVHVAFTPIETRVGDYRNANPAFGGGFKIGGQVSDDFSLAVVGEAAHEVRLNTLSVGEAWIGRAYASLTRGDARSNATVSAGVVGYDNRSDRYVVPMVALGSQYGWDDRLAFVTEVQWFPQGLASLSSTTLLAARFRHQDRKSSLLGIHRTRIDLGTVIIDTKDDLEMAPWLQVGLGW